MPREAQDRRLTPSRGESSSPTAPYLHADHDDQRSGHRDRKGLVVGQLGAIIPGGLRKHAVGDEEHEDGGVDALGDADEEFPLVEEEVQLAWLIQLRVLHAPLLGDVLCGEDQVTDEASEAAVLTRAAPVPASSFLSSLTLDLTSSQLPPIRLCSATQGSYRSAVAERKNTLPAGKRPSPGPQAEGTSPTPTTVSVTPAQQCLSPHPA